MLVYRAEHEEEHWGPSWHGLWGRDFTEDAMADGLITDDEADYFHSAARGFPPPLHDDFNAPPTMAWCGCACAEQFFRWFSPSMCDRMAGLGYVLRIFDVPDDQVQVGRHQVLFDRPEFEPIAEFDLVDDRERLLAAPLPIAA